MAYTVKEAIQFAYPIVGQHWVSRLIGTNNLMMLVNQAISMIYNYWGFHIWSWAHRSDAFVLDGKETWTLLSRRPVRKVDKFWTSAYRDIDKITEDPCVCPTPTPETPVQPCCVCNCTRPCEPLVLDEILPQNQLCAGQYQISWGFTPWQWGMDGRLVRVNTWKPVEVLWMTYFAWPLKLEKFTDLVPLPDSIVYLIWWIIWAMTIPMRWAARSQEDLNLMSLVRKELDALRAIDNIYPKRLKFDTPEIDNDRNTWAIMSLSGGVFI